MTWRVGFMTMEAARAFRRIVRGAPPLQEVKGLPSQDQDAVLLALEAYWARQSTEAKQKADRLERQYDAVERALLEAQLGWKELQALRVVLGKEEY